MTIIDIRFWCSLNHITGFLLRKKKVNHFKESIKEQILDKIQTTLKIMNVLDSNCKHLDFVFILHSHRIHLYADTLFFFSTEQMWFWIITVTIQGPEIQLILVHQYISARKTSKICTSLLLGGWSVFFPNDHVQVHYLFGNRHLHTESLRSPRQTEEDTSSVGRLKEWRSQRMINVSLTIREEEDPFHWNQVSLSVFVSLSDPDVVHGHRCGSTETLSVCLYRGSWEWRSRRWRSRSESGWGPAGWNCTPTPTPCCHWRLPAEDWTHPDRPWARTKKE